MKTCIKPFLSPESEKYLEEVLGGQKLLMGDWLCNHTLLNQATPVEEVFNLLVTLVDNKLQDFTSKRAELEGLLNSKLASIKIADLTFMLFTYSKNKDLLPFNSKTLSEMIASVLKRSQIRYSNSRANFSNQIFQLASIRSAASSPGLKVASEVYRLLDRIHEGDDAHGLTVKHCVELAHCLLQDFSRAHVTVVDSLLALVFSHIDKLQANDVLLVLKLLLLQQVRDPQSALLHERLSSLDEQAKKCKANFNPRLSQSIWKFVGYSGLIDLERIPFIVSKISCNPSPSRPHASRSEKDIIAALEEAGACIIDKNTNLENSFPVDLLLQGKVVVEVNGRYHYTSECLLSPLPVAVADRLNQENLEENQRILDKYRGDDAIKIATLLRKGYLYIGIDTRVSSQMSPNDLAASLKLICIVDK